MSNSVNSNNYNTYSSKANPATTTKTSTVDAWFEDPSKNDISVDSFLQLMIAQLKNQDFNNPVDDAQYLTQLAQFASMQQMQELAYYSKSNYVNSMLGKEVSAAKMSLGGVMHTVTGVIDKVSLINKEFTVFIKDQMFTLEQIMEVKLPQEANNQLTPKESELNEEEEFINPEVI